MSGVTLLIRSVFVLLTVLAAMVVEQAQSAAPPKEGSLTLRFEAPRWLVIDGALLFATAWEPYQELFQGVIRCLHSDFRLGGLLPGERRVIRGKVYLRRNDMQALLRRYAKDFPEHQSGSTRQQDP